MKTKMISFIFLMAFVTIAFNCNRDPIESPQTLPPLFQELQGRYQSDDGYTRLTLNTNRYSLYLGGWKKGGNYSSNDSSHIELDLIDGTMSFEIRRDLDGQIVGLVEALKGDPVLHRMVQEGDFISYDNLDMEVITQNLGGLYLGIIDSQHMILELDNIYNRYSMKRGGQDYFGDYDIELTTSGVLLVLYLENEPQPEEYYLHIIENRVERITSFNVGIQGGLLRETPPTNPNDGEISYGTYYSSQDIPISLTHNAHVPNAFNYCRERLATLFGKYENAEVNPISMIEITPHMMYATINNERISVDYTVEFRSNNGRDYSSIRFVTGKQIYLFELGIHHDTTITGLMNGTISLRKTQDYKANVTLTDRTLQITGGMN